MNLDKAEVKWTKDYDQFKRINYNRDVLDTSKLVDSMNEYGFLLPILVNQNFMIVDGQHRVEAARKANVSLSYIQFDFDEDKLPILISTVNSTSSKWKLQNFINMWADLEKEDYIYLNNLMDKYKVNLSTLLGAIGGRGSHATKRIKKGAFELTGAQRQRSEKKLNMMVEIRELDEKYNSFNMGSFSAAIMSCITHPDYNHEQMLNQLNRQPGNISKCPIPGDYIKQIEDVYNFGKKTRIIFGRF